MQCKSRGYAEWFKIGPGVLQGAPMSMLPFQIFINPLLRELLSLHQRAKLSDVSIGCPTLADDMAIATLTVYAMQIM